MHDDDPGFIFLHGFLGRAETRLPGIVIEYFRGLRDIAAETGITLRVPQMPIRAGVEQRAETVKPVLDAMPMRNMALVGVSMGGLVARALAARHDPDGRIKTVVTIASPHRGSPLADRALSSQTGLPGWLVDQFRPAFTDLSTAGARDFNIRTPDRADVRYYSWGFARARADMPFYLRRKEKLIHPLEGDNDGMVSVQSARWGQRFTLARADHTEAFGWSMKLPDARTGRPFDQKQLWRDVIALGREAAAP